ncbi:hypothetical protein BOX15_Mlig008461g1 [Macrostomum lignano]|nr:hypothetical protein BOX15_Mlig008461g1 [Macrostomum lignano]
MVDWVNVPPHESSTDFFKRRPDLSKHLDLVNEERELATGEGRQALYNGEGSVQLIIVSKDAWYNKGISSTLRRVDTVHDLIKNNWNLTDFLLLNWGNLQYWLGDLGYLAKGEKVFIQSGHPDVLIGVYRHLQTGKFYVWNEMKTAEPESLQSVQSRWQEIVEYNHFKTDAVIWIVNTPFQCSRRLCKWNTNKGKVNLPWTFAAACGDFVTLDSPATEPLKQLFRAAGGNLGLEQQVNVTTEVRTGRNKGDNQVVSCYAVGMVAAKTIVFEGDDDQV